MSSVDRLLKIMAALRDPDTGCPWDCEQTFDTIVPYTIEEAYEVAEAIEHRDWDELRLELGDLLFQVVFYAQMAAEEGRFDFEQVATAICEKMERRHPHVFADAQVEDAEAQTRASLEHKAAERAAKGQQETAWLDSVNSKLPALQRAKKLQKRAAEVGFDWPEITGVLAKLDEEQVELKHAIAEGVDKSAVEAELGDLLFSCVNLARHLKVDPEAALRKSNHKFEQRFGYVERALNKEGRALAETSLEEMDRLWNEAKDGLDD